MRVTSGLGTDISKGDLLLVLFAVGMFKEPEKYIKG